MRTFVDLYEAASAARLAAGAARQAAAAKQQKRLKTAKLATKAAQQLKSVKSQPASSGSQRDPKVVAALKNVPVSKKPTPGKESQQFVDKAKSAMQSGQKADAASAKKENLAAKMERKKNLQAKKNQLQKQKKAGEEKKAKINAALAKATSGPRASSGSNMGGEGASADKAALQSAGRAVQGTAQAVSAATGLDKKMDKLRKKISNRLRPNKKKGLATGAASTGRNEMRKKSTKPTDPWKKTPKDSDPWKEEFSHWREEFIFEVDDKVPTKKEKTIQPMSGKNTIIINPDSMQEAHKKDHTYLETDMKKRKKNNEKAIADMKKVKDDTVPRWMREGSDWRSELGLEEGLTDLQRRRYLGRKPGESKERLKRINDRKVKKAALAALEKHAKGMKAGIYDSYESEGELVDEGVLDAALKTDKKMGELHKKVDNDVKRMKAGKKFKEEVEHVEEGIGMTMAKAMGSPPALSKRMKLKQALLNREINKETAKNKTRKFSGRAASEKASKADKYMSASSRTTAKEEFEIVDEIFMSSPAPKKQDPKKNQKKETWYERDERKRKERKEEVEHLDEMPYQVYGSPDGKKEKKIGKPVKSKKYADARAAELADTHKKTGGKYRSEYTEEFVNEAKKGLWDNIHARRKAGKPKRKPGDKNYPETLNIKEEEDNTKIIGAPLKSEEDRIPARQGGNQWGIGKSLLCPVCGVVGCTNPEHQVEEGVMPAAIDPAKHRAAQKATKIRNLMKGAATAGEKEAARRKTRGPALAGEHYDWRQELGEGAAWTRKEGKNKSGGLNEKGRKSYERENPGSDLKAPSKEPGNKRRSSFCARMKGMKKKLTSKKTASDPDSRINKSLRAWNC